MIHLIKYSVLTKIRNFNVIFWSLIFPLVLTTLMYLSIGRMEEDGFETIPVALVAEEEAESDPFLTFLESVEQDAGLVMTEEMSRDAAEEELKNGEIKGIFCIGDTPSLFVGGSGLPESILQMILESYIQGEQTLSDIRELHPEKLGDAVRKMNEYDEATEQVSLGGRTTNGNAQFFYALIGMASLYGCFLGFQSSLDMQANLTALAARRCASPVNRMKTILSETAVSFGLHFVNMMILLGYMKYILRLDFSGSYLAMLPVLLVGSITGVTMGMFITSIGRMGEGSKAGIMVGVSMTFSFLAGLMNGEMKNLIDRHAPVVNRLNPAALISDALYCMNVFDAPARYREDMLILSAICVLLAAGTFLVIRRERYGSI